MPKAIIFDLWETLGTKGFRVSDCLRNRLGIPNRPGFRRQYEQAVQLRRWKSLEDMSISFLCAFSIPVTESAITRVKEIFLAAIAQAKVNSGIRGLLNELAITYRLGLLSNTTVFESSVVERWGIAQLFSARAYSWQIGYLKPDERAFYKICRSLGLPPRECVFVDDEAENVSVASTIGMRAYGFTGVTNLRGAFLRDQVLLQR